MIFSVKFSIILLSDATEQASMIVRHIHTAMAMTTINQFTKEQENRIEQINAQFESRLAASNQGQIQNEDGFEKKGLFLHLQETADFRQEYINRAVGKIGCKRG